MTGFSIDMTMYKGYDFRCLKPKAGMSSEKWPHYEMHAFRAAKTKEELKKVEEIPFDKYFYNFEDPEVLKSFTDGSDKGLKLWKRTFGFDWAQWTLGNIDIRYIVDDTGRAIEYSLFCKSPYFFLP